VGNPRIILTMIKEDFTNTNSVDVGKLLSILEDLHPQSVYYVEPMISKLRECGLDATKWRNQEGLIVNGWTIEVEEPEWGEPGIFPAHLLHVIITIIAPDGEFSSNMTGRGFYYRDILEQLKDYCQKHYKLT
jgi:hypothetical protein